MTSFAAWGLTILGLAVVTTVAEMLLPQGKTKKVIRSVFATVTVLVIVTPLPTLLKKGVDFEFPSDVAQPDKDYLEYIDSARGEMFATSAKNYLKEKGYDSGFDITVDADGFTVKAVSVKFDDSGMTGNDGHINKSEIIRLIADYFDIGEEAIMTYG